LGSPGAAQDHLVKPPREPRIHLPVGWRASTDLEHGVLVSALAPRAGRSGVVPSLRLEVEPVKVLPRQWYDDAVAELGVRLPGFELDHEEIYDLGDHETCSRRFTHRRAGHDLVTEQWAWWFDGLGFTLSGCVAREDHAEHDELFGAVAATFGLADTRRSA
jgi:hypothetical protein